MASGWLQEHVARARLGSTSGTAKSFGALAGLVVFFSVSHAHAAEKWQLFPHVLTGMAVGGATEVTECSATGEFECQLPAKTERSLGVQVAPWFEAGVAVGPARGFRFGLGVRYLPGALMDTGSELHFGIIPEGVLPLGEQWALGIRAFNSLGIAYPHAESNVRQQPTLRACDDVHVPDSQCDTSRSRAFLSLGFELGLRQRLGATWLRYQLGAQMPYWLEHARAGAYIGPARDDSEQWLSVRHWIDTARFVAGVGVDW